MSNILINKKQLEEYLLDFHSDKKAEILEKFKDFNFDCGKFSFRDKMKKIISMPKFGKRTLIYWISRGWSEEEALEKRIPDKRDPETSPMNLNFWIKKGYSEEDAEFQIKSQRKLNKEYWIERGCSEEESILKSLQFQKNSNNIYLEKMKSDIEFKNKICSKRKNSISYWTNLGYSVEESKKLQSKYQKTFSLEKCIEKYGVIDGKLIWNKRQKKWQDSLLKNGKLKNGFSEISIELFDKIYINLNDFQKQSIKYHNINGGEFHLIKDSGYFLYDFTDIYNKKIIEFNGDLYHGNPNIFKENDICVNFKKRPLIAKDLWKRDNEKKELAEKNGFEVLTIWELEYKKDKENTLKKCLDFLEN